MKTAVEWLLNEISLTTILDKEDVKLFEQAKEMEKEHQEETALAMIEYALDNIEGKNNLNGKDAFEQYYNETFKKK